MNVFNPSKMIYRNLGNTGLKVSVLSLGNMINYKD
jgi:aryl-alcohol dehydrogenase-like predicted oxidoreductase